jgi:hypothetical protein
MEARSMNQVDQAARRAATWDGVSVSAIGYVRYPDGTDNSSEVIKFIGGQAPCKTCGGRGEYETEYGPRGCAPCNSRCIAVQTGGTVTYADWGDVIVKRLDGILEVVSAAKDKQ